MSGVSAQPHCLSGTCRIQLPSLFEEAVPGYHCRMKYELTNIPVIDAYKARPDCTICFLEDRLESQNIEFYLGNSVMVPEMRVAVNRDGFCGRHLRMLLAGKNKLGLSLMLHTHLDEQDGRRVASWAGGKRALRRRLLPWSRAGVRGAVRELADREERGAARCLVCDRLTHTLDNYRYTIVKLFQTNGEFRDLFSRSGGFCRRHSPEVLRMSAEILPDRPLIEFVSSLIEMSSAQSRKIGADLEGFAQKFDYRSTVPMSDEERTSLVRAVRHLGADDV